MTSSVEFKAKIYKNAQWIDKYFKFSHNGSNFIYKYDKISETITFDQSRTNTVENFYFYPIVITKIITNNTPPSNYQKDSFYFILTETKLNTNTFTISSDSSNDFKINNSIICYITHSSELIRIIAETFTDEDMNKELENIDKMIIDMKTDRSSILEITALITPRYNYLNAKKSKDTFKTMKFKKNYYY
jgi:hypothetical protein